ncbi:MAG: rhomboid family intramembrane serine protease [Ilumatobacteraceae bacterium]
MAFSDANSLGMNGALSEQAGRLVLARHFIEQGEWYRLISSGFVHFGFLHVAMNMFLLYQLGRMLEPALGSMRFGLVYFASLLGGSMGALLLTPDAFTGGASGAVFGLMAAAVVGLRHRGVNPWRTGLGAAFAINIVFTLAIPGVSVGGHFGGALVGAACGSVLLAPTHWRLPRWTGIVTPLALGLGSVAVVALFVVR